MQISFRVPGYVYNWNTEQPVVDPSLLSTLNGWRYETDSIYHYLDKELADLGVIGGTIRATWTADRGLEIVIDYRAPDNLHQSHIDKLRDETVGQLSDGIGEGGFEITLDGKELVLVADTGETLDVEQVYDGILVPLPSRIARAARDGNMDVLEEAIASGEAIDSTIQGESGLHLAITYGHVDAALLLISKGANTNLLTSAGETPLHICALSNSLSDSASATVARALLGHGADKRIKTSSGNTAASFAENRKKAAMLRVLSEHN